MLPEANFISPWCQSPSSRAQNRDFCALLGFGTLVFRHFEHKIVVFVLFWPSKPLFSGFSSTNSRFLCFFGLRDPFFRAFRAQNRGFCAFLGFGTLIFGRFEHKIEVFVRFWGLEPPFSVSVSAITCHQYKESRVICPAILSSIYLGGDLGMLRSLNREAKRLSC